SRLRFIFFEEMYDSRGERIVQSEVNTWLAEIFPKAAGFATGVGNLLTSSVQSCFFFAVLLVKSPVKAAAGLAALIILGPAIRMTYGYVRRLSHEVIEHFAEVQRSIVRVTRNRILIRLLRTEAMELARLRHASLGTTQNS